MPKKKKAAKPQKKKKKVKIPQPTGLNGTAAGIHSNKHGLGLEVLQGKKASLPARASKTKL